MPCQSQTLYTRSLSNSWRRGCSTRTRSRNRLIHQWKSRSLKISWNNSRAQWRISTVNTNLLKMSLRLTWSSTRARSLRTRRTKPKTLELRSQIIIPLRQTKGLTHRLPLLAKVSGKKMMAIAMEMDPTLRKPNPPMTLTPRIYQYCFHTLISVPTLRNWHKFLFKVS